jgi:transcriptional regulator with XRE-family HTH domain
MTQKELAAALGISEAVVSRWELGTDPLKSLIHLRNLCWELNCELDYFIED